MGVATNIVAVWPTLSSIASNSTHCHPADRSSTLNILLSHTFCPSLCRYMYGSVTKKIVSVCIDYIIVCAAGPRPWIMDWLLSPSMLSRNLKPRKLILRAFSDIPRKLDPMKITRHTVQKLYLYHSTLNHLDCELALVLFTYVYM